MAIDTFTLPAIAGNWVQLEGSPRLFFSKGGSQVVWEIMVKTGEEYFIAEQLWTAGGSYPRWGITEPAWLLMLSVDRYTKFWVSSVQIENFSPSTGGGKVPDPAGEIHIPEDSEQDSQPTEHGSLLKRLTVVFSMKNPVILEVNSPGSKLVPLATTDLYWNGSQDKLVTGDETPEEVEKVGDWDYKMFGVNVPLEDAYTLVGWVNDEIMTSTTMRWQNSEKVISKRKFSIGTVRLDALVVEPTFNPFPHLAKPDADFPLVDVTLKFKTNLNGWNYFRRKDGELDLLQKTDSPQDPWYVYPRTDLNILLIGDKT